MHPPLDGPNPYAPPAAPDFYPQGELEHDHVLASRGRRFLGSVVDALVYVVGVLPIAFWAPEGDSRIVLAMIGGVMLAVVCIQSVLIATSGQSIAKKLLGMRIIRTDGSPVGFGRGVVMRSWVFVLLGSIPYIGGFVSLVDAIYIFGAEQRCLHDIFADTIVVLVD